ncbi:phosphoserine phosphatase SerB [Thiohalorhabdus sp.]|uniref:phosphoserine phosphatase SerB n=1 Tax=Thiohalorhabdus sp. TaxID=3094134 RepID=UPI002FC31481
MATAPLRLSVYSAHPEGDPAAAVTAATGDAATTGGFAGFRMATAVMDPAGAEGLAPSLEGAQDTLAWGWRARRGSDSHLRGVVMGPGLSDQALATLVGELHTRGQLVTGMRTLSVSFPAVELALEGDPIPPSDLTRQLQRSAESAGVDLAVLPAAGGDRDWGLLMMDMDSTLLAVECIDEIAETAGVKAQVAAITERAMQGELHFKGSLIERVAMLAGLPERVLTEVYNERIRANPGAERLLEAARGMGLRIAVVSGGFSFFTERLEADMGLDFTNANVLEVADGHLTGRVSGEIVDGAVKAATLRELRERLGLDREQLIAMGDGANDLAMMTQAGLGVAYHAKPRVRAEAPYNLAVTSLDGLLYMLGLTDDDIESYRKRERAG